MIQKRSLIIIVLKKDKYMKSEELMIGDWVIVTNSPKPQKQVKPSWYSYHWTWWINFLEPIPLTAEILEKNGFERNECFDYNGCIFFSFPNGEFSKRSGFGIEKRDDKYYITDHALMPMRYVHELQHLLRLCGLNELANNFKILEL